MAFLPLLGVNLAPVNAAELVQISGSLELENFTQSPVEFSGSQSAFAQVSFPEETFLGASNPQFVTGPVFLPNPLATPLPLRSETVPGGERVTVPFDFPEISNGCWYP